MADAVLLWALVLFVGILALPAAGVLFSRLPGRGLALARPLGLLLAAYPIWLLASVHAVPYGRAGVLGGLAFLAALGVALWLRTGRPRPRGLALRLWLAGELVFTVAFFGWAVLRSFAPEVWNTEKPMDMAFVNAVNRSEWFPPHDPWLSGEDLNYYYFGHYLVAFLLRATGIDPAAGYNLGVALFFALAASAVFAVAATLVAAARRRAALPAGLVAVVVAMVLGNLAGTDELIESPPEGYDWWAPSRVIDGGATEFPFFSFLLGDLHAHMMVTPFALAGLAYSLQIALRGPRPWALGELLLAALVFGALYAVNTLDFPTAMALLAGSALLFLTRRRVVSPSSWRVLGWTALLAVAAVALYAPFVVAYVPTTEGLALVREHAPFTELVRDVGLVFALPLWVVAAALAARLAFPARYAVWGAVALMVVLVLLAPDRLAGLFLLFTLAAVALHAALDPGLRQAERFFWLLVSVGLGLIAVTDFAYIRDAFDGTSSYRFNTIFKATYQAWFLLAVAAAFGIFWTDRLGLRRGVRRVWQLGLVAVAALLAAYPVAGSYARTGGFSESPTLDGLHWLEQRSPGDVAAIRWLRAHVEEAPTILEAVGADFSPDGHARISTFTGLPSVLGWAGHELQWGHDPGTRGEDVEAIYATRDLRLARRLLDRYGVRYVVVGSVERRFYPRAGLAKFRRLGRAVFALRGTVVYAV